MIRNILFFLLVSTFLFSITPVRSQYYRSRSYNQSDNIIKCYNQCKREVDELRKECKKLATYSDRRDCNLKMDQYKKACAVKCKNGGTLGTSSGSSYRCLRDAKKLFKYELSKCAPSNDSMSLYTRYNAVHRLCIKQAQKRFEERKKKCRQKQGDR